MADPGTIQFSTETVGSGSLGVQPVAPNVGISGGGVGSTQPARSGARWFDSVGGMETPLGGNLPEFIEQAFAPALENTKRKRMWEGFTAARSGKQMDEIAASQPWYTKIFGPTNYEIGSQVFHVQKQVADMEADIIRRMPELRELGPEAMAEEFNRVSQSSMMGNPFADSMLQKMLMDRAGPLMDLHTKERVAWQNHELLKGQVSAGLAQSAAFQEMSSRVAHLGADHPDYAAAAGQLAESEMILADTLATSQYQTDESRFAFYRALVMQTSQQGQFYALNKLMDFGLMDALNIEQQEEVRNVIKEGRRQYKANLPIDDELIRMEAEWTVEAAMGMESAETSVERAKAINERWTARTGDREGLIGLGQSEQVASTALSAYHRAQFAAEEERKRAIEAASTEADKERLRMERVQRDTASWKTGSLGLSVAQNITTLDDAEALAVAHYSADPVAALQAAVYQYGFPNYKFVSQRVKNAVQQGIPSDPTADWTEGFHNSYLAFKAMESVETRGEGGVVDTMTGRNAAREYFGDRNTQLMRQYEMNIGRGMAPDIAYSSAQRALSDLPIGAGDLSKEEFKHLEDELAGPNWAVRLFTGEEKLTHKGVLRASAVQQYELVQRANPDKDARWWAKAALQAARAKNVDVAGEYSWFRKEGQKPITAYAGEVSPDVYGVAVRQHIRDHLRASDIKGDDYEIFVHRQEDRDGFPVLRVWAYDVGTGNMTNFDMARPDFERVQQAALKATHARVEAQRPAERGTQSMWEP